MSLRRYIQGLPLSFNVMLILCIWALVGGLAWVDSFDLTDDVDILHVSAGVMVDTDEDEAREKFHVAVLTGWAL